MLPSSLVLILHLASYGPLLDRLARSQKDPEVRARLEAVAHCLLLTRADALDQEGRFEEALILRVDAGGAPDATRHVRERLRILRDRVREESVTVGELIDLFARDRRYALPLLMEFLGDGDLVPRARLFLAMGEIGWPEAPNLLAGLQASNDYKVMCICRLLEAVEDERVRSGYQSIVDMEIEDIRKSARKSPRGE